MANIHGTCDDRFAEVSNVLSANLDAGLDLGASVAVTVAGEPVVDKTVCDSFEGTDLAALLPADAALVVAGMQTDWCIRATTLAALQRGHRVTLAAGAHSTLPADRTVPAIITAVEQELAKAGAEVVPAGSITFG